MVQLNNVWQLESICHIKRLLNKIIREVDLFRLYTKFEEYIKTIIGILDFILKNRNI